MNYYLNKYFLYLLCYLTYNLNIVNCTFQNEKSVTLPPCRVCKAFIESFKKGLAKTESGKFDGGDVAWEEEKLGTYATSEVRLTEIQEMLCSDLTEGKNQCYALAEKYDLEIEDWWFHQQNKEPDIFDYFCIRTFKYCCPENHFGPKCKPCDGYPDNICNNNGKCRGAGTRKGNGSCLCDAGYDGEKCDTCAANYYESYKDEKKLLCSKCHVSCEGRCSKSGSEGCEQCKEGWIMDKENGCLDINECAALKSPCGPKQFCVNNDGSFHCLDCDRACDGCTGDGPDVCNNCAKGYTLKDGLCIDEVQESRKQYVYLTRYLTYLGMLIATFIIFNNNMCLAAIVGSAVGIFIGVSEYMLNNVSTPQVEDIAKKFFTN